MTVTRPDGSTTALDARTGQNETWTFATTTAGLYVVTGTLGCGRPVAEHPLPLHDLGAADHAPDRHRACRPAGAEERRAADWPTRSRRRTATRCSTGRQARSATPSSSRSRPRRRAPSPAFPPTRPSSTSPRSCAATTPPSPISARSPTSSSRTRLEGSTPMTSQDGKSWRAITQLPTFNLPDGQTDGWFRDSDGTVHVLTRHLTYYALVTHGSATKLALRILTAQAPLDRQPHVRRGADGPDRSCARDRLVRRPERPDGARPDGQDAHAPRRDHDPARTDARDEAGRLPAPDARRRDRTGRGPSRRRSSSCSAGPPRRCGRSRARSGSS